MKMQEVEPKLQTDTIDADSFMLWRWGLLRLNRVALSPLSREELDNPAVQTSAYEELGEIFKDYDQYTFQSVCIAYDDEGVAINPYVPHAGLEAVADLCWDLNPNDRDRPVRNGAWVEKFLKELRSTMIKAYEAYRKSGNLDAENKYKEFLKFAANYSIMYAYAFVLMPEGSLDQLGRALPESEQRGTGRLISSASSRRLSPTPGAENRRWQRKRRLEVTTGSESSSLSSPATDSMSSMMSAAIAAQQQQASLMFFATHSSDPAAQERALAMLARQGFSVDFDDAEDEV